MTGWARPSKIFSIVLTMSESCRYFLHCEVRWRNKLCVITSLLPGLVISRWHTTPCQVSTRSISRKLKIFTCPALFLKELSEMTNDDTNRRQNDENCQIPVELILIHEVVYNHKMNRKIYYCSMKPETVWYHVDSFNNIIVDFDLKGTIHFCGHYFPIMSMWFRGPRTRSYLFEVVCL